MVHGFRGAAGGEQAGEHRERHRPSSRLTHAAGFWGHFANPLQPARAAIPNRAPSTTRFHPSLALRRHVTVQAAGVIDLARHA